MHFKKRRGVYLLTLLLTLFLLQNGTAQTCEDSGFMGRFQQDATVTLTQACPTCTTINVTVTNPNSTIIINNSPMTLSGGVFVFGPNDNISEDLGTYFVQGVSNLDNPFKSCYTVTNIEREIEIPEAIIYIILTTAVFILFMFTFWGGVGLPGRNRRNELGRVIGVEKWKYVKLACLFMSYASFTWLINILLVLSNNVVTLMEFQGFFTMVFHFLMAGLYAFFVGMMVIFFILGQRDLKLQQLLSRGIEPR